MKMMDLIENDDFCIRKMMDLIENDEFCIRFPLVPLRSAASLRGPGDLLLLPGRRTPGVGRRCHGGRKHDELCIQNEELCIQNE